MTFGILEGQSGEMAEAQDDVTGATGDTSYNTGGISYTSKLGRVDMAVANIQSTSNSAKVTSINSPNQIVIQLFSQGTADAADEGQELEEKFIADNIQVTAYRL